MESLIQSSILNEILYRTQFVQKYDSNKNSFFFVNCREALHPLAPHMNRNKKAIPESYSIRRTALTFNIPYTTTLAGARATSLAIEAMIEGRLAVKTVQEYHDRL